MLLVDRDRDAFAVVPDRYHVLTHVDVYLDHRHLGIPLKVVGSIDEDFICFARIEKGVSKK